MRFCFCIFELYYYISVYIIGFSLDINLSCLIKQPGNVLIAMVGNPHLYYTTQLFIGKQTYLLNDKEFCFFLIGLNSIFSTLPQSEYTSRAVSTPRVRYIRACPPTNQSQDVKLCRPIKLCLTHS